MKEPTNDTYTIRLKQNPQAQLGYAWSSLAHISPDLFVRLDRAL